MYGPALRHTPSVGLGRGWSQRAGTQPRASGPPPLQWLSALEDWPCAKAADGLGPGAASSQASGLSKAAR